jgi:NTP pyrophosphatase (non-canonical NTP hydrolase)
MKVLEEQNLQTPVRFRAPQQETKLTALRSFLLYLTYMDLKEYKEKALRTDWATYEDYTAGDATARFEYSVIGLVTESAKLLDMVKKSKKNVFPIKSERVEEELGDLLWYLNLALDEVGMSFEDLMESNIKKIGKKYPVADAEAAKLIRG